MRKNFTKYLFTLLITVVFLTACSNPVDSSSKDNPKSTSASRVLDNVAPSQNPPGGLLPNQVPMLVSIGFDDNSYSGLEGSGGVGGMSWCLDLFNNKVNNGVGNPGTFDGTPVKATFYNSTVYVSTWGADSPVFVKRAWKKAYDEGHEIGNHTNAHAGGGRSFTLDKWMSELQTCHDWLTKPYTFNPVTYEPKSTNGVGIPGNSIVGFRTPFLEYNSNTMTAVQNMGYLYDCSVNEGFQTDQDGANNFYPYTLDNGSPGNDVTVSWGTDQPIGNHPGLWEMPLYAVIVPPDDKCVEYGIPVGFRQRLKARVTWDWNSDAGKITGLDYNMFWSFKMTKEEFVATMKYTLDLRLNGNRAPFMFGAHSDYYSSKKGDSPNATYLERQQGLQEFVEYALSKQEVRMVPVKKVMEWMKNPVALNNDPVLTFDVTATVSSGQGTISPSGTFTAQQYSNVPFTVSPSSGQKIDNVLVNGNPVEVVNNSFVVRNIQSNTTVAASFIAAPTYTVSTETVGNGTINPSGSVTVTEGDNLTLDLTYGSDTSIKQLLVDNVDQNVDRKSTTFILNNITKNTTVKVIYEPYVSQVEAVYTVTSDWNTGFQANIAITNKTNAPINSWTLNWVFQGNQQVNVYSAVTSQVGKSVTVSNESWNGTIQPGATLNIGLGGTYSGTNDIPEIVVQ